MAEIFGKNREQGFRNMVDDPFLKVQGIRNKKSNNCCGFAASGDLGYMAEQPEPTDPEPVAIKAKVQNMKTWDLAKTALAIVGLYVVVKYAWTKFKK